jgi:hypothetical protein
VNLARNRVIVDFDSTADARKVEETVKTGYVEVSIESLEQWMAVEDDLAESYGKMAEASKDPARKKGFHELEAESKKNVTELSGILKSMEELDRARVRRIELLKGLPES